MIGCEYDGVVSKQPQDMASIISIMSLFIGENKEELFWGSIGVLLVSRLWADSGPKQFQEHVLTCI